MVLDDLNAQYIPAHVSHVESMAVQDPESTVGDLVVAVTWYVISSIMILSNTYHNPIFDTESTRMHNFIS